MLKNIKVLLLGLVVLFSFVGCGGSKPDAPVKSAVSSSAKTIYISSRASYNGPIAQNIKSECSIDAQVMTWIQKYAAKQNINVIIDGKPTPNDTVLKVDIIDAISSRGFGYGGHNKYVIISGKLYNGKNLKASFKAARRSGGGYFGAYRSSCSVLGSCAKTLGRDVATWLSNPTNNIKLGDSYLIR